MAFLDDTGVASLVSKIKAKIDALVFVKTFNGKSGNVTLEATDIPSLPASKITSGTLGTSRIPSLDASKITSGTFSAARLPNATTSSKGGVIVGSGLSVSSGTLSAPVMTGATSSANGAAGIVPAPVTGEEDRFLRADGNWCGIRTTEAYKTYSEYVYHEINTAHKIGDAPYYTVESVSKTVRRTLWENASPSSNFGAQTITLSEAVDNYLFWLIECYLSTTVQDKTATFMIVGKNGARLHFAGSGSNSNRGNSRDVEIDSTGTQLTFSANYYNNTSTNANMIPSRVYGFFHL